MSIGETIRNPIMVRFAEKETEPVVDWCQANSARNAFDKDVLDYPATKVLAATDGETVFAYMPEQGCAMLESIGPNPDATPLQIAASIVELVKAAALLAHGAGFREIYFLASDDVTGRGAKKLGFEELPYKVYRRRLE
jgi:hypothetical protein